MPWRDEPVAVALPLRRRDIQVLTDLLNQYVSDLSVPGDRGLLLGSWMPPNCMPTAFTKQFTAVATEMAN